MKKCPNCNSELNENELKCSKCGSIINKKGKLSIITILSLIISIIIVLVSIGIVYYCFYASAGLDDQSAQGYGWLMIFVIIGGMISLLYYGSIFIINLEFDLKKKYIKNKNIIMTIALLLPLLLISFMILISNLMVEKRKYTFKKISIEFPSDMSNYSHKVDYFQRYKEVGFFYRDSNDYKCNIIFGVDTYNKNLDMIDNLKERSDRFTRLDSQTSVYDIFDSINSLDTYNINNKYWYHYEKQFTLMYYQIYGIVINNDLYKIETLDSNPDHTSCNNRINKFLSSVKYKYF